MEGKFAGAIGLFEGEGVVGFSTDVIRGYDDENLELGWSHFLQGRPR